MPHVPDSHVDHDLELVAALAASDLEGARRTAAEELVAACDACAALRVDLLALTHATGALPVPRRRRDFRLTAEQAAALRPGGLRGILAALAGRRFAFTAPLGAGLAAIGVAGILLASLPGMPATAPVAIDAGGAGAAGAEPQATADAAPAAGQPAASDITLQAPPAEFAPATGGTDTSMTGEAPRDGTEQQRAEHVASSGSPLLLGSAVLAALGVALLLARWLARRFAAVP